MRHVFALDRGPARPRHGRCRRPVAALLRVLLAVGGLAGGSLVSAAHELPEYQLKVAFLYNFAVYTEWPPEVGTTLNLCVQGHDPFGSELDALNGRKVAGRSIAVQRVTGRGPIVDCQILFVSTPATDTTPRETEAMRSGAVLTVSDSQDIGRKPVALNMVLTDATVSFEVNLKALGPRLTLSSKLLRLASKVYQ